MIMTETAYSGSADEASEVDDGLSFLVLSFSLRESLLAGQLPRESWCEGGKSEVYSLMAMSVLVLGCWLWVSGTV
jgi:hypothetical protein